MLWPFGGEHWCNLEGKNLHLVVDLSHHHLQDDDAERQKDQFEISVCSLGVIGTRYVRPGQEEQE